MIIILLRHAIAEDKDIFKKSGKKDSERPLTKKGIKQMQENARGIKTLFPKLDSIYTSPYKRAMQTATILQRAYGYKESITILDELVPSQPIENLLSFLRKMSKNQVLVFVGHEPHLSKVFGYLVFCQKRSKILLKKGSVCVLEFSGIAKAGSAKLICLAQPKMLQQIGA